jgi:hypothetical protein
MLQTGQPFPKIGSQLPEACFRCERRRLHHFGSNPPSGVQDGNWIQTVLGKGYFVCMRLYSSLEPFFTKVWQPSAIEVVQ